MLNIKLSITNVGPVKNAEVELKGLTVIVGYNDTGKSAIGKIAYALTKSFENYESLYKKKMNKIVYKNLREVKIILRNSTLLKENEEMQKFYDQISKLKGMFHSMDRSIKSEELRLIKKNLENSNFDRKKEVLKLLIPIDDFLKGVKTEVKFNVKIQEAIKEILQSEFEGQINNYSSSHPDTECNIQVSENGNNLIDINIDKDDVLKVQEDKEIDEDFSFESVAFIETSFYFILS